MHETFHLNPHGGFIHAPLLTIILSSTNPERFAMEHKMDLPRPQRPIGILHFRPSQIPLFPNLHTVFAHHSAMQTMPVFNDGPFQNVGSGGRLMAESATDEFHTYACKHIWCVPKGSSVIRTNEFPTGTTHMNGDAGSELREYHPLLTPFREAPVGSSFNPQHTTDTITEKNNENGKFNEEGEHHNETSVATANAFVRAK